MSISRYTDQEITVYQYNGILVKSIKERPADMQYNMDRPHHHYVKGKRQDQQVYKQHASIYLKF